MAAELFGKRAVDRPCQGRLGCLAWDGDLGTLLLYPPFRMEKKSPWLRQLGAVSVFLLLLQSRRMSHVRPVRRNTKQESSEVLLCTSQGQGTCRVDLLQRNLWKVCTHLPPPQHCVINVSWSLCRIHHLQLGKLRHSWAGFWETQQHRGTMAPFTCGAPPSPQPHQPTVLV